MGRKKKLSVKTYVITAVTLTLLAICLLYTSCTGVVPAVSSAVRKLTTAGEAVLVQPPVYNIFYNSICNNGRRVIENRLLYDGKSYRIDSVSYTHLDVYKRQRLCWFSPLAAAAGHRRLIRRRICRKRKWRIKEGGR